MQSLLHMCEKRKCQLMKCNCAGNIPERCEQVACAISVWFAIVLFGIHRRRWHRRWYSWVKAQIHTVYICVFVARLACNYSCCTTIYAIRRSIIDASLLIRLRWFNWNRVYFHNMFAIFLCMEWPMRSGSHSQHRCNDHTNRLQRPWMRFANICIPLSFF